MNPITPWLVCFALLLITVFVVYVAIKTVKDKNEELKHLKGELQKQKEAYEKLKEEKQGRR